MHGIGAEHMAWMQSAWHGCRVHGMGAKCMRDEVFVNNSKLKRTRSD